MLVHITHITHTATHTHTHTHEGRISCSCWDYKGLDYKVTNPRLTPVPILLLGEQRFQRLRRQTHFVFTVVASRLMEAQMDLPRLLFGVGCRIFIVTP